MTIHQGFQHFAEVFKTQKVFKRGLFSVTTIWFFFGFQLSSPPRFIPLTKPLNIRAKKSEPPRAAFDQISDSHVQDEWSATSVAGLNLNEPEKTYQKVSLQPMLLSRHSEPVIAAYKMALRKPTSMAQNYRWRESTKEETETQPSTEDLMQNLTPSQAQRLLVAQRENKVLDQDWSIPTWKQFVKQELAQAGVVLPQSEKKENDRKPETGRYVIEGQIHLKGLPNFNSTQISIRRVSENISKEIGVVSTDSSQYRIEVDDLNGFLVAELTERSAGVIGTGQTRLSMNGDKGTRLRGPMITIEESVGTASVFDSNQKGNDPSAAVAAFASTNDKRTHRFQTRLFIPSADLDLQTDALGFARLERIRKQSWMLVRAEGEGIYPSMYLAQNNGELSLPGFRDSMVKALLSIYREAAYASDRPEVNSVVWGRVTQDGKPVSGAKVEVETDENAKIVYFNQLMLPDLTLETTTDSGYFAIIDLESGWHTLISRIGDQFHSHGNVVVDENTISPVVLSQKLSKEKVEMKVFDAFTGQPMAAQVQAQNLPETLDVDGLSEVWVADIVRLSLVQVLPVLETYLPVRSIHSDNSDFWHIPMIRKDWVAGLRNYRKISDSTDSAVIVGFVETSDFEVFLPHMQDYSRENIVYFDTQGLPIEKGIAGGGFVLFNVAEGVQSVSILTADDLIASQVLPIDKDTTSVLKFEY